MLLVVMIHQVIILHELLTNVFRIESIIEPEKLSIYGLAIGPMVKPWLNRGWTDDVINIKFIFY